MCIEHLCHIKYCSTQTYIVYVRSFKLFGKILDCVKIIFNAAPFQELHRLKWVLSELLAYCSPHVYSFYILLQVNKWSRAMYISVLSQIWSKPIFFRNSLHKMYHSFSELSGVNCLFQVTVIRLQPLVAAKPSSSSMLCWEYPSWVLC